MKCHVPDTSAKSPQHRGQTASCGKPCTASPCYAALCPPRPPNKTTVCTPATSTNCGAKPTSPATGLTATSSTWPVRLKLRSICSVFRVPELTGTVEVLFTLDLPAEVLDQGQLEADHVFHATVQTAGEFRNLKLNTRNFGRGRKALLRGWPPSEDNLTASLMLVDEIELSHNGRLINFHRKHPKMKKKRKGGKPANSLE